MAMLLIKKKKVNLVEITFLWEAELNHYGRKIFHGLLIEKYAKAPSNSRIDKVSGQYYFRVDLNSNNLNINMFTDNCPTWPF